MKQEREERVGDAYTVFSTYVQYLVLSSDHAGQTKKLRKTYIVRLFLKIKKHSKQKNLEQFFSITVCSRYISTEKKVLKL